MYCDVINTVLEAAIWVSGECVW